jgi:hypothetical protein
MLDVQVSVPLVHDRCLTCGTPGSIVIDVSRVGVQLPLVSSARDAFKMSAFGV